MKFRQAALRNRLSFRAFETERPGDHGNGQDAQFTGQFSDHRRASRARATAHAGGDKHHVGAVQ